MKEKQQIIHFKGHFQRCGAIFSPYKDFPQQNRCQFIIIILLGEGRGGNKPVCLTYIIEKGEDSQAVGFVSGFNKALVLVRIVMDDVELKDKQTQCHRKEKRKLRQASKQSSGGGFC